MMMRVSKQPRYRKATIAAAFVVVGFAAAACGKDESGTTPPIVVVDDPTSLKPAQDENSDPAVFELTLEARESTKAYGDKATPVWAYAGSIPGPFIDAKVGDQLVVHFKNALPEATSIHWHGIRLPAAMDGSMSVQTPVPPGGTFEYKFTLKDPGLFWYHPHVRSDIQVQKGLYGAIRVRGPNEPTSDQEHVLMLDDVRLKEDGRLAEYLDDTGKMMGREGNTLLINGVANPTLSFVAGGAIRLRLVNVANGRFFNLRLPGHVWRVIGTDGGLLAKPYDTERLLIAPGERYDVMLIANSGGGGVAGKEEIELTNDPYERGHDSGGEQPMPVGRVRFTVPGAGVPLTGRVLPSAFAGVAPLEANGETTKSETIVLNESTTREGELVFTVNGNAFPAVTKIMVERGGLRLLEVKNESEMAHPFHLHGFFFQVFEKDGARADLASIGNKDTIILPSKTTMKLLARFDEPGMWMYHCHILEHAEGGMMGEIHVE